MERTSGSNVGCEPSLCSNKLPGTEVKTEKYSVGAMCWAPPFIECNELKLQTQELRGTAGPFDHSEPRVCCQHAEWRVGSDL